MRDEACDLTTLDAEARIFGKYLVGRIPPQPFVERYREANQTLLTAPVASQDAALVEFVRRHPWSVSLLDAACGLLRPGGLLRTKILIMAAVLEASSEFADEFLPRDTRAPELVLRLGALGLVGAARALLGAAIYAFAVRP